MPLGIMCIDFDWGIRLYDLYILLGRGLSLPLFSVFMNRVLLEYAHVLCFICFHLCTYRWLKQKLLRAWNTKKSGFSPKWIVGGICRATYSARQARLRIYFSQRRRQFALPLIWISISFSKKLAKVKCPKVKTSLIGKECERTSHQ